MMVKPMCVRELLSYKAFKYWSERQTWPVPKGRIPLSFYFTPGPHNLNGDRE